MIFNSGGQKFAGGGIPAYGSYTGDGSSSKTLLFDFEPGLVIIQGAQTTGDHAYTIFCVNPSLRGIWVGDASRSGAGNNGLCTLAWGSNEVTLKMSVSGRFNLSGYVYSYVAFPKE